MLYVCGSIYVSLLREMQYAVIAVKCQCVSASVSDDTNVAASVCWCLPGCQDQLHVQVLERVPVLIGAFHQMSTIVKRSTNQILREKSLG